MVSLPVARIPVQLEPTYGGPLDKRQVGTTTYRNEFDYVGAGQLYFDTTIGELLVHDGTSWISVATNEMSLPGFGYSLSLTDNLQSFYNSIDTTYIDAASNYDVFLSSHIGVGSTTLRGRTSLYLYRGGSAVVSILSSGMKVDEKFEVQNTMEVSSDTLSVKTGKNLDVAGRFVVGASSIQATTGEFRVKTKTHLQYSKET